jgi:F0F1-type ATP synthase alpha subunit
LNSAQLELNSQLQSVAKRRRDISSAETNKLNSLQGTLGNQISELDRKISGLKQKETDEMISALNALQATHTQSYLRSHSVMTSRISGIGQAYKSRLYYAGFQTAADIDYSVSRVSGIGATRQAALMSWRHSLEYRANQTAPNLSSQDKQAIENKYRQTRQVHESEKQRLKTQLDVQITNARQYFADARQSLNMEEQQIRAASAQKIMTIQQLHDADIATLNNQAANARNHAMPAINELSEKLRAAQKQTFALRWQSAKREKEARRFASLHFQNYLRKVVTL